jgi:hypothetical protein
MKGLGCPLQIAAWDRVGLYELFGPLMTPSDSPGAMLLQASSPA